MARKTNKTNHVLNLLAGKGETEDKVQNTANEAAEAGNVQVIDPRAEDDKIAENVKQLLEKEFEAEGFPEFGEGDSAEDFGKNDSPWPEENFSIDADWSMDDFSMGDTQWSGEELTIETEWPQEDNSADDFLTSGENFGTRMEWPGEPKIEWSEEPEFIVEESQPAPSPVAEKEPEKVSPSPVSDKKSEPVAEKEPELEIEEESEPVAEKEPKSVAKEKSESVTKKKSEPSAKKESASVTKKESEPSAKKESEPVAKEKKRKTKGKDQPEAASTVKKTKEESEVLEERLKKNTETTGKAVEKASEAAGKASKKELMYIAEPAEEVDRKLASEKDYDFVNVMEMLTKEEIMPYMKGFGNCTCSRCVADVMALALTNLPPKYVVMNKASKAPLMNFYAQRYAGQITVEITKACVRVREHPHHNRG